jgi:hypothetical protein
MNKIKELQEKQMGNLLKAIELKNIGIEDKSLSNIVDYVIQHEIKELQFDVALYDKNDKVREYKFLGKEK